MPHAGLSLISVSYMKEKFPFKISDLCFFPSFILVAHYGVKIGMPYVETTSFHFSVIQY